MKTHRSGKDRFATNENKLLDSNTAIYLSKRTLVVSDFAKPGDVLHVSLMTYMEVVGCIFTDATEELFTSTLFRSLQHLPVTQATADRVIIYRKRRRIKLPDAIILVTAMVREYNCQLITKNVDDFVGLDDDVVIINPFNLT